MDVKSFDLPGRAVKWKRQVQDQLAGLQKQVDQFAAVQAELIKRVTDHEALLADILNHLYSSAPLGTNKPVARPLLARRGDALLILLLDEKDAPYLRTGSSLASITRGVVAGDVTRVLVKHFADPGMPIAHPAGELLLRSIRLLPDRAQRILNLEALTYSPSPKPTYDEYALCGALSRLLAERPDLVDFAAAEVAESKTRMSAVPFDRPEMLPRLIPPEPKQRSVLFLHNSYYHFNCLSDGLRRRGWDALTVSLEDPNSAQRQFYHGEDLNLFDPDPAIMREKMRVFFRAAPERFGALHFYGMGAAGFFPELFDNSEPYAQPPFDLFELRRHRTIIGYMPTGCLDGAPQSAIRALSKNVCARCVWETRPDVCSDLKSLAWAERLDQVCDWIGIEGDWAAPPRTSDKYVHGPVAAALDANVWQPDMIVPDDFKVQRPPGTILVYHAVGNYKTRRVSDRDIKGTGAVLAAIETLKAEGLPVQLYFASDVPSRIVRFFQVQADIVVDQLNYGRIGANARESMMLGRPTIVRLDPNQGDAIPPLRQVMEAPLVDATERNVTDVLRALINDPQLRADLGRRARDFAVAWHGSDACAERYERVIDRVRAGLKPDSPDLYPVTHI